MTPRCLTAAGATLVLAALTVWCVSIGVETRYSTGDLLTAPIPITRVVGGWIVAAAVAGTAAVLAGMEAGACLWRGSRRGG